METVYLAAAIVATCVAGLWASSAIVIAVKYDRLRTAAGLS